MIYDLTQFNRLFFVGDIHGSFYGLEDLIKNNNIENSCIVICGDVGLGFAPKLERATIKDLNAFLKKTNNNVIGIRGNHDNPSIFYEETYDSYFKSVPDYSILLTKFGNILCIGGAVSVDRLYRKIGNYSWWEDEGINQNFDPKSLEYQVDIVASHSSPYGVFPFTNSPFLDQCIADDPNLITDLHIERSYLQKLFYLLNSEHQLTHWYYGHYHNNARSKLDNCNFILLGILKLIEHQQFEYALNNPEM